MSLIDMLMTQEARIKPFERYAGGKALYGLEEVRKCRMEFGKKTKVVYKNPDGSIVETVASALMFCPMPPIPVNSIIECEGTKMRVIESRNYGKWHRKLEKGAR